MCYSKDCYSNKALLVLTFLFFVSGVYSSSYRWCLGCFCMSHGFEVFKQFISGWKCTFAGCTLDGNFILQ